LIVNAIRQLRSVEHREEVSECRHLSVSSWCSSDNDEPRSSEGGG
jgi:hypothetical protein